MKTLAILILFVAISVLSYSQDTIKSCTYYDNGNVQECLSFVDNVLDGVCESYSISGVKTAEAFYTKGLKDGIWKVWNNAGELVYEMQYSNGTKVGEWKQYAYGKIISTKVFLN